MSKGIFILLKVLLLSLSCYHLTLFAAVPNAHQQPAADIILVAGAVQRVVTEQPIIRVALANPSVVEARITDSHELLVLALQPGHTDVLWWLADGSTQRQQVRVEAAIDPVLVEHLVALNTALVSAGVKPVTVQWVAGQAVLSGQVSQADFDNLQGLLAQFPQLHLQQLQVESTAAVTLELSVQVYEISRRSMQHLGLRWQTSAAGPAVGIVSDISGGGAFRVLGDAGLTTAPGAEALLSTLAPGSYGYFGLASSLSSTLHMLQERGEGRVLATPKLRVESGEQAAFLAGGEIPVPQITLQGATEVDFKNYGIALQVAPVQLVDGRIRTQVMTELSQPDFAVAVQGVPGLKTRRTETTVTVNEGETLVIAGLVNQEHNHQQQSLAGTPAALARFFGSKEQQQTDTELVILITPINVHLAEVRQRAEQQRYLQHLQLFSELGCTGMQELYDE